MLRDHICDSCIGREVILFYLFGYDMHALKKYIISLLIKPGEMRKRYNPARYANGI